MTTIEEVEGTRLDDLALTGVAGVKRGANRAQFGADGWQVMKADGTAVRAVPLGEEIVKDDGTPILRVAKRTPEVVAASSPRADWFVLAEREPTTKVADGAVTVGTSAEAPAARSADTTGASAPTEPPAVTKGLVYSTIEALAEDVRKSDDSMSREQAIVRVLEQIPELKDLYYAAPGEHQPVVKSEPSQPWRSAAYEQIERYGRELQARDPSLSSAQAVVKAAELNPALYQQDRAETRARQRERTS